jgi:hypothetical protein
MTDREKLKLMVGWFLQSIEGDTHHLEEAYDFMYKEGFVDLDGFEIYDAE